MTTSAPRPANEHQRLEALWSLGILDTPPEERFDRFTRLAKRLLDAPVALISFVESDRQWFKSNLGLAVDEAPRDISFCGHTILANEPMVIPDALEDERFCDNPFVTEQGVRFYAGYPIEFGDGLLLGTLCIIDYKPRTLSKWQIELLSEIAMLVKEEVLLHNVATIDELTSLSNRRGFLGIGRHTISLCRRLGRPATLMFFDLDGFKEVNDNYGHAEGDRALQAIGRLLLLAFRDSDVVSRLGGDEFCVLLTGTNADDVQKPMANLREGLAREQASHPYTIDYSVGTVSFDSARHQSINDLLEEADKLMYENKRARKQDG